MITRNLQILTRIFQNLGNSCPKKAVEKSWCSQFSVFYCTKNPNLCGDNRKNESCSEKTQKWPAENRVNFRFHSEIENLLNMQVNCEFNAFYCYLSMANYFGRVDVSLPGCEKYFTQMYQEEFQHARKLMNYVKMRGGCACLHEIKIPETQDWTDWKCPLFAFDTALNLETNITESLENLNSSALKCDDSVTSDFIVTNFLHDQMKSVNEIAKMRNVLSGIGDFALARFIFDQDLLRNHKCKEKVQ